MCCEEMLNKWMKLWLKSFISIHFLLSVPDTAPENITYRNISSMEIELSFFPPSDPNGIIQKYTVYLRESNGTEQRIINSTLQTLRITGQCKNLKPNCVQLRLCFYRSCCITRIKLVLMFIYLSGDSLMQIFMTYKMSLHLTFWEDGHHWQ